MAWKDQIGENMLQTPFVDAVVKNVLKGSSGGSKKGSKKGYGK